jgi:hypothetical protein
MSFVDALLNAARAAAKQHREDKLVDVLRIESDLYRADMKAYVLTDEIARLPSLYPKTNEFVHHDAAKKILLQNANAEQARLGRVLNRETQLLVQAETDLATHGIPFAPRPARRLFAPAPVAAGPVLAIAGPAAGPAGPAPVPVPVPAPPAPVAAGPVPAPPRAGAGPGPAGPVPAPPRAGAGPGPARAAPAPPRAGAGAPQGRGRPNRRDRAQNAIRRANLANRGGA